MTSSIGNKRHREEICPNSKQFLKQSTNTRPLWLAVHEHAHVRRSRGDRTRQDVNLWPPFTFISNLDVIEIYRREERNQCSDGKIPLDGGIWPDRRQRAARGLPLGSLSCLELESDSRPPISCRAAQSASTAEKEARGRASAPAAPGFSPPLFGIIWKTGGSRCSSSSGHKTVEHFSSIILFMTSSHRPDTVGGAAAASERLPMMSGLLFPETTLVFAPCWLEWMRRRRR